MSTITHEIDDGVKGWIRKYAYRHHWRVPSYITREDLIQDGYMHFYRCVERYGHVEHKPHFMALFKRTYATWIVDLSKKRTGFHEMPVCEFTDNECSFLENAMGGESELGAIAAIIATAPTELKEVLQLFLSDIGLAKLREPHRKTRRHRETTNEKWCRILGKDPTIMDLPTQVRRLLSSGAEPPVPVRVYDHPGVRLGTTPARYHLPEVTIAMEDIAPQIWQRLGYVDK